MRFCFMLGMLLGLSVATGCENAKKATNEASPATASVVVTNIVEQIVETSCGECQFGMKGSGCDLAVRIDGKLYYVDGSSIDDHGDAHGDDGLCNCVRKAKVTGEIKDGRFVATSVVMLSSDKSDEAASAESEDAGGDDQDQ